MGWFWGDDSKDSGGDPLRNLDPSLREFLKKEAPTNYKDSNPPAPVQVRAVAAVPKKVDQGIAKAERRAAPVPTAFPDGRYEHIWKGYRDLREIEEESKTDQDRINDILESFKDRRYQIGLAALENCTLEQDDVNNCMRHGGVYDKMTMCRGENRALRRCHEMQSKFLKALGYLSTYDRPPEVDEQIQMHADSLYHRMLAQEKAVADAKAAGIPVPTFPPLMSHKIPASPGADIAKQDLNAGVLKPSDLKPSIQEKFKERLAGLSPEERELEQRAIKAEMRSGERVAEDLHKIYEKQAIERRERQAKGKGTVWDTLRVWFVGDR